MNGCPLRTRYAPATPSPRLRTATGMRSVSSTTRRMSWTGWSRPSPSSSRATRADATASAMWPLATLRSCSGFEHEEVVDDRFERLEGVRAFIVAPFVPEKGGGVYVSAKQTVHRDPEESS